MRESKRGQRKRAQVMVLSCWCHRQTRAVLPPGCHLHLTQYPPFIRNITLPHSAAVGPPPLVLPTHCTFLSLLSRQPPPPPVTPPLFPPSGVPSLHKLYCQHCFVYLFFFFPSFAQLGLCFWHTFRLPPIRGRSYGVLPLRKL